MRLTEQPELGKLLGRTDSIVPRLSGIAPSHLSLAIQRQWGPLLRLQDADLAEAPGREELFREASTQYKTAQIWPRYLSARKRGKLPVVLTVEGPVCPTCRIGLPAKEAGALKRGEAAVCDYGHILVLKA